MRIWILVNLTLSSGIWLNLLTYGQLNNLSSSCKWILVNVVLSGGIWLNILQYEHLNNLISSCDGI